MSAALREPTATRPTFGGSYGITDAAEGLLAWSWAAERLAASRNYWIGTTGPDGRPHAAPVWGLWLEDGFHFGTSRASRKGRNLDRDPRVAVHLESGDEVVILEGTVETIALDDRIADVYTAKYDYRPNPADAEGERWYRLRPARALAWLERDFPASATRFDFP